MPHDAPLSFDCSRLVWLKASLLIGLLFMGCAKEPEQAFYIVDWQGNVDETASPAVQAKQDALIRLFRAVQDVGVENISDDQPDLKFNESFAEFFEDAVDLHRWQWDGPPEGDTFPVLIVLSKDEPGLPQVEKRRRYVVRRSGRLFTIRRAPQ